ncbi:PhzF family phenazine biosynthesis protein [Amphritea balenae]|uniref:PhzF family phenazine biosynthesis protein n=1 Tax=Amphritea balenae TaxID=452629 RepID=A0A3P1SSW2_9GAMM|nr:PhzF family phenazine biosynthesis protein [Amphritea balenae]RRC99974.1 PhzF family phenazine biosynthesis protein [Amphritea balenae]GGK75496.1 phenazine biosynthesis protein PhzF [Amphritea balenae]
MKLKMNVIDAFTDRNFKGNSAAVIMTETWLADDLMQSIAIENNLSETAFVKQTTPQSFDIRWFSPMTEIDFCGHATLASAFVIFSDNPDLETITFYAEAVGELRVNRVDNGYFEMSFPNRKPELVSDIPAKLLQGLSIEPVEVLQSEQAYFAVYANEADVLEVTQNPELIKKLAPYDVVITAKTATAKVVSEVPEKTDFISRYFWPASGGDEDPVTGSIHAGLAPYWAEQLDKPELTAYQASARGGVLLCRVAADRVYISGQAVQYLEGYITV